MWMEIVSITLSEISQSEKDKYHMILLNLRNKTNEQRGKRQREKPRNTLLTIENKLIVTRGEMGGGWLK